MRQWRLIYDSPMNGAANMAADEAILQAVAQGASPPTLRLYGWEPFCLSLGYGQSLKDVDLAALEARGWNLVRRPTGGRAILHGDELTYSVALPADHPLAQGAILDSYLRLSAALLQAMTALGASVTADPDGAPGGAKGAVCFEVPSRYEITFGGKKLIGSAQVRKHGGMLQHGTIPLWGDIGRICDVLCYATDAERAAARQLVGERATTLESAGVWVTWEAAAAALVDGFAATLDIDLIQDGLTPAELARADELYRGVYSTDAWNHKR